MKKKGLIISTAVMVVVLIAALTTGTFAWFSSSANATVEELSIGAMSATSLQIGVVTGEIKADHSKETAPDTVASVAFDAVKYSSGWTGVQGIGPNVNFSEFAALSNLTKAVAIASDKITGAGAESSTNIDKGKFFKAEGDKTNYDSKTVEVAKANEDYFDATFVVVPVKDVYQIYMKITVQATNNQKIGMAAAIHFAFYVDGKLIKVTDGSALETATDGLATADTNVSAFDKLTGVNNWGLQGTSFTDSTDGNKLGASKKTEDGNLIWEYYLPIAAHSDRALTSSTSGYSSTAAKVVTVLAWLDGTDESCTSETTSTGGTISIEFIGNTSSSDAVTLEKGRIRED